MLRDMVRKINTEIDIEKDERVRNEEMLLTLLESTCQKLQRD
jgi:hypothetical protein